MVNTLISNLNIVIHINLVTVYVNFVGSRTLVLSRTRLEVCFCTCNSHFTYTRIQGEGCSVNIKLSDANVRTEIVALNNIYVLFSIITRLFEPKKQEVTQIAL